MSPELIGPDAGSLTDTALEGRNSQSSFRETLRRIVERLAAYPDSGQKADKAFFDDLSGC